MPIRQTERGFDIYAEFTDTYGTQVRIQESSNVEPRCWIFLTDSSEQTAAHLDYDMVSITIGALTEWAATHEPTIVDHDEVSPGSNGVKPHRLRTKRR